MRARVILVFPPLVERNFGGIYPSTAVLAAYLEQRGFPVEQIDLNAAFLEHVLSDEELTASSDGLYTRSQPATIAAARWTRRSLKDGTLSKAEFLAGHHLARDPLDTILQLLVTPYSVDPDRTVLDGSIDDPLLSASYTGFFNARVDHLVAPESTGVLLGLSVPMGPQLLPTLLLAAAVRAVRSPQQCRIVLGGPALSLLGDADLSRLLQQHPAIDCVVRFDGECPLSALAEQVAAGEWAPARVPGTSSGAQDGIVHVAPEPGPALNSLPAPHYSKAMLASAPHAVLGVTQARGCYWGKCDYCDFVEVYKGSPPVRARSPELVVADIRRLVEETGIRRYRIITESIPPAFARRFATLLGESGLDVRWSSFAMADKRFDTDLLRLMASSGCEFLVIGLESMVSRVLKLVHKSADREENRRFIRAARGAGIRLSINLIPDLPTTTKAEALAGLDDLEELADCVEKVQVFNFEATRSSRIGRSPSSFGLVSVPQINRVGQAQLALNTLPVDDPAMTSSERTEVLRAYRAFAARVNAKLHAAQRDSRTYIEVLPSAEGPVIMNFATSERIRLPRRFEPGAAPSIL